MAALIQNTRLEVLFLDVRMVFGDVPGPRPGTGSALTAFGMLSHLLSYLILVEDPCVCVCV